MKQDDIILGTTSPYQKTTETYTSFAIRGNIVAFELYERTFNNFTSRKNDFKKVGQFFAKLSEDKLKTLQRPKGERDVVSKIKDENRFYYFYGNHIKEMFAAYSQGTNEIYKVPRKVSKIKESYIEILQDKNTCLDNICKFEWSSHMFHRIDGTVVSIPRFYNYIHGRLRSTTCKLKNAFEALNNNEFVSDVKKVTIPYYNAETDNEKAVEFVVHFPQDIFDKYVEKAKRLDKEYWSVRLWELILESEELGLKQFQKEEDPDEDDW